MFEKCVRNEYSAKLRCRAFYIREFSVRLCFREFLFVLEIAAREVIECWTVSREVLFQTVPVQTRLLKLKDPYSISEYGSFLFV